MSQVDTDLQALQNYRQNKTCDETVSAALMLRLINGGLPGGSSVSSQINWANPVNLAIAQTNTQILAADSARKGFIICNLDLSRQIYLNFNASASLTSAIYIVQPGQTLRLDADEAIATINAIASNGTGNVNCTYRTAN